ncbi:DUF2312 domain-containing protein [Sulfitobacter sp. 1A13353]|uniref:DUF2312 domain-containing protein n=1 Tax=Sulfitobacter sp. 1A13353 TaxID=3368568 RepID=UPI003747E085
MTDRVAADELRAFVERVERLNAEKADIAEATKDVFAELKGRGCDAATVRKVIARRKMDRDARAEGDAVLSMYEESLA